MLGDGLTPFRSFFIQDTMKSNTPEGHSTIYNQNEFSQFAIQVKTVGPVYENLCSILGVMWILYVLWVCKWKSNQWISAFKEYCFLHHQLISTL